MSGSVCSTRRLAGTERRKEILIAATRVFARAGFHGATTRQIAQEAGVAEALLYRHFDSKQALFVEAVRTTSGRLIAGLREVFDPAGVTPIQALDGLIRFYRRMLSRNRDMARMVFLVSAELDDPAVRSVYLPFQDEAVGILDEKIAAWQREGVVSSAVPSRALAWLLLGAFQTVTLMKQTDRLGEVPPSAALALAAAYLSPATGPSSSVTSSDTV